MTFRSLIEKKVELSDENAEVISEFFNGYTIEIDFKGAYSEPQTRTDPADAGYDSVEFTVFHDEMKNVSSDDLSFIAKIPLSDFTGDVKEYFKGKKPKNVDAFDDLYIEDGEISVEVDKLKVDSKYLILEASATSKQVDSVIDSAWEKYND